MLHDISDHYPINLTVSKAQLKEMSNKDILEIQATLISLLLIATCTKLLIRYQYNTHNGMLMKNLILL